MYPFRLVLYAYVDGQRRYFVVGVDGGCAAAAHWVKAQLADPGVSDIGYVEKPHVYVAWWL